MEHAVICYPSKTCNFSQSACESITASHLFVSVLSQDGNQALLG